MTPPHAASDFGLTATTNHSRFRIEQYTHVQASRAMGSPDQRWTHSRTAKSAKTTAKVMKVRVSARQMTSAR